MPIDLELGGYAIRLDERAGHACLSWPIQPFDAFCARSERPADIELRVHIVDRLPGIPHGDLIYDACHGLWTLHAADGGYVLEALDTRTRRPRSRTRLAADMSRGEVWLCGRPRRRGEPPAWNPMHVLNPIVEACLLTRLARQGGLLLHAAGVLTEHGAWVFTGASGAGKSTLSDLFAASGRLVLSDERMIVRDVAGEPLAFGTPWPGAGRQALNEAGPLTALYCIAHGRGTHVSRPMSAREVSTFVLPQTFLPHWDRDAMDRTLAFLVELVERVDCTGLAFVKTPDVVGYLLARSAGRRPVPA